MTTWKQLSRPLRLAIAAPWCLLAAIAAVAATPATRALLLDAANHPTIDVDLASSHWTGTLAPARLPASVPLLSSADQSLSLPGDLHLAGTCSVAGPTSLDNQQIVTDGGGDLEVAGELHFIGALCFDGQEAQAETVTQTHTLTVYDMDGVPYRLLCAGH